MTARVAHRCQTCGLVLEPDVISKWCESCEPPPQATRRTTDPYDRAARDLVEQGLASYLVIGRYRPTGGPS